MTSQDAATTTVLEPTKQSLLPFAGCSVLFHLGAALSVWLVTTMAAVTGALLPMCRNDAPRITESIEITVVSLPKSASNMPDRLQRVKRAAGEVVAPEPPPVRESDLAIRTDTPAPSTGNVDAAARQRLIEEMEREQLLNELLDGPEGAVDRDATDPNGQADAAALAALGVAARGDPEMQRWIAQVQQMLMARFKPLAAVTQANPDLSCRVAIVMDPVDGVVSSYDVSVPSGVLSFDQAAERAVQEVPSLPPPPAKYADLVQQEGIEFVFVAPRG